MVSEAFTVVALPHSVATDAPFHVSLFVSPRLQPDGPEGRLGDFELFRAWTDQLLEAEIRLVDQNGKLAHQPILDLIDRKAWTRVFPPDTPVRGREQPEWGDRHWRTFRAREVHDNAKLMSTISMLVNPTSPGPADPERDPLVAIMQVLGGDTDDGTGGEVEWTSALDSMVGERFEQGRILPLRTIEARIAETQGMERALVEQHRARRFYERPESAVAAPPPRPIDGETRPPLPRPDPDFHERVSLLADHPGVLRALGLVIDLRVADPGALAQSSWISGFVDTPSGVASQTCRTRCEVAGEALVTVPRTGEWHQGRLEVGDADMFGVLDVDADGSALKTDRFLWTLPRLVAAARSGADVTSATPAHRSGGFTVVRTGRALETQERITGQIAVGDDVLAGKAPLLDTEDVTQGYRVEVYDATTNAWNTLHARRVDAEVTGFGTVLADIADHGFVQTTTASETAGVEDSPIHVHEAMFSWGGWSLSAPRPGNRVRHEGGAEIVEDPDTDPDPVTPLVIHSRVEPGTLPRLRYGRSYAFRVWGVDLAGNSRPHALGPVPPVPSSLAERLGALLPESSTFRPGPGLESALRSEAAAAIVRRRATPVEGEVIGASELGSRLDPDVVARLRARRSEPLTRMGRSERIARVDRRTAVERRFEELVLDPGTPLTTDTAVHDPLVTAGGLGVPIGEPDLAEALTVTTLRPYLRWEPVQPPAVVARHANSPGESLLQLVIRSGVTQDPETLDIAVIPPGSYNADQQDLGYRATSERHLAPPKTSQSEAELHAMFDTAIGSSDPDDHARLLAVAIRESGTFFDVDVPRLDDPTVRDPQPGIALVHDPGVPASTLKELPLPPGEPPAPGQYVVHDVDQLRLPYLPDPVARGISLVFPDAGRDRQLVFPFGTEGFTARYKGRWPDPGPFRLVLAGGETLGGRLDGRALTMTLPPGDVQRFRLSSHLDAADLDLFGFWRMLPPVVRDQPDIAEAAADGWMWIFTPFDRVTLVHAVPRPLERPDAVGVRVTRATGSTDSSMFAGVDVHGPSTEMVTAEAGWTEYTDDVSVPIPSRAQMEGVGFTVVVRPEEDVAVLAGPIPADLRFEVKGFGPVWLHQAVHRWGDTKHRTVEYRFRASTRFREYFDPSSLVPDHEDDDGDSVIGVPFTVSVPSSAPPAAPVVHSVLPLLRWDTGTEPEQPMATRRARRAGVRIYVERPWYSSGEGELLAVLVAPLGLDERLGEVVSQWGADPIWRSADVARRGMFLEFDNLVATLGFDQPGEARPVAPPVTMPLDTRRGAPMVTVLGYQPQYSEERRLWYVDVAIDPGEVFWPFVRLAVARYQPHSIDGCHLSEPVKCHFVQLLPDRTASVSRTDVRHVRVVVSGPVGTRGGGADEPFPPALGGYHEAVARNRRVIARLQRVDRDLPTDLGWLTVDTVEMTVRGHGGSAAEAGWVGVLTSPVDIPLRTPGGGSRWRVTLEEWELLLGDPSDLGEHTRRIEERRLVYADELML